jgi:putative ABC transport system ATP-binding protein
MLRLNQVVKIFAQPDGDVTVLDQASFHLPGGRSAALLGESGSGKSTLLHLIAGLDKPDAGELVIDGHSSLAMKAADWNRLRRDRLSLIFQQYHLVPTLTVLDNLQLQARLSQRLDTAFRDHLIDRLGLDGLTRRLPHQLSGGQQQRVAIARALLHRPALVLADEPTGNLDEGTSERVIGVLVDLVRETGSSLLMVTHSAHMASFLDEQWRLHHGQLHRVSEADVPEPDE